MIEGIPSRHINFYWKKIEPLLLKVMRRMELFNYYRPEDIKGYLEQGNWQCWAACSSPETIDCIFITFIECFPTGRKEFVVYAAGGTSMKDWAEESTRLWIDYAKHHECACVRISGREGWAKIAQKYGGLTADKSYITYHWDT